MKPAPPRGPTVWPTVVGVLGIIWGAFGLLANLCGFLMTPSMLKEVLPEEMQEQIISQLPPAQLVLVSGIIGFILSLWLLWGSIKLLQRNAASRTSLNAWSVITILFTIIMAVWMFVTLPPPPSLHGDSQAQAPQTAVETTETTDTTGHHGHGEHDRAACTARTVWNGRSVDVEIQRDHQQLLFGGGVMPVAGLPPDLPEHRIPPPGNRNMG